MNSTTGPRIYVASLSDYNNGILHGAWIDAAQDADDIRTEVSAMLRESKYPNIQKRDHACLECKHEWSSQVQYSDSTPAISGEKSEQCPECDSRSVMSSPIYSSAEEWAIHDFEGFEGAKISEHESFDTVSALADAIEEHGAAFAAWWGSESRDDVDADSFLEAYRGEWDSLADYVENFWDDCGDFDADKIAGGNWWHPAMYVDWERMAHDLQTSGDIWTHEQDGKVYVFRNC